MLHITFSKYDCIIVHKAYYLFTCTCVSIYSFHSHSHSHSLVYLQSPRHLPPPTSLDVSTPPPRQFPRHLVRYDNPPTIEKETNHCKTVSFNVLFSNFC